MKTPHEAAKWMLEQVQREEQLYQSEAASHIEEHGDPSLSYYDDDGNLCIAKPVLTAFRKIDPQNVVYERSEKMWRLREPHDAPGRQQ